MNSKIYNAVYDFELMPYALGDVLTWNVQTAIQCETAGLDKVNINILIDGNFPASIYQKEMITSDNYGIYFNELFGSFGTHPYLGNIFIFRNREDLLNSLYITSKLNNLNLEAYDDYIFAINNRSELNVLVSYFTKYIYYHDRINDFSNSKGRIPLLKPSLGCEPDISGLINKRLAGKKIVVIHPRLRKLDIGYAGSHTYSRDSDFVEWYEFLQHTHISNPEIQFVLIGRLQEKPIEFLRLPNVMSLRSFGFGLGHELTLMLRANLFIGTSSGFAAMVNFSEIPYFITKMNKDSCIAYGIPEGHDRLPFAKEGQFLIYDPETSFLLEELLIRGLGGSTPPAPGPEAFLNPQINTKTWEVERQYWLYPGSTTARFHIDDTYADKETAFLIIPKLEEAKTLWRQGNKFQAWKILDMLKLNFPRMILKNQEYEDLILKLENNYNKWGIFSKVILYYDRYIDFLLSQFMKFFLSFLALIKYFWWLLINPKYIWTNRNRIPRKIRLLFKRFFHF